MVFFLHFIDLDGCPLCHFHKPRPAVYFQVVTMQVHLMNFTLNTSRSHARWLLDMHNNHHVFLARSVNVLQCGCALLKELVKCFTWGGKITVQFDLQEWQWDFTCLFSETCVGYKPLVLTSIYELNANYFYVN